MKTTVAWTLMFRVSTRRKAEEEIERAGSLLGHTLRLEKCERHWKIPELWVCEAIGEFEATTDADRVFHCLLFADRLGRPWSVRGPDLQPEGTLQDFGGVFDHRRGHAKLQSLEWAEFQIVTAAA